MENKKYLIKVTFHKHSDMRFFSQLDLVGILERCLRRANLPLYFTKGFNPHVKMSFGNALKLGLEGNVEVIFYFTRKVIPDEFRQVLSPQLPAGFDIIRIQPLDK